MIERLGSRIAFLHLRSIQREAHGAFHEAAHLEGDADMAKVIAAVHHVSTRERRSIPMRPDHGHQMIDDLNRDHQSRLLPHRPPEGTGRTSGMERGIAHALDG